MRKVLIIDDDRPTLTMFQLFMRAYGYQVSVAEDGKTGIRMLEKEGPEIVFTDLKMPDIDGFEVLRRIKSIAPKTEVVVITGFGDMEKAVQALNLQATDFVNKPISRSALDAALKRAEQRLSNPGPSECRISRSVMKKFEIWRIDGALDATCREQMLELAGSAIAANQKGVVVSFNAGTSIDGAGIGLLNRILSDFKANQCPVAICGLTENFKTLFNMIGIAGPGRIFDTEADALEAL